VWRTLRQTKRRKLSKDKERYVQLGYDQESHAKHQTYLTCCNQLLKLGERDTSTAHSIELAESKLKSATLKPQVRALQPPRY
jgi:hypothetical protein